MAKQDCSCPVCPPRPAANAYTTQRKNFEAHFRNQHPAYTFLDEGAAAALGTKPLGAFFAPAPKAPAAGMRGRLGCISILLQFIDAYVEAWIYYGNYYYYYALALRVSIKTSFSMLIRQFCLMRT